MNLIVTLEYLGTFMFAFSGAAVACDEKLDYLGVMLLSAITALGGGMMRDAVLNSGLPYALSSWTPYIFVLLGMVTALRFSKIQNSFFVVAFDAIGLAAFTVSSGINAINAGYNCLAVIFCCFSTAVGGGIIRDIIVNRKPYVFRKDIYAATAVEGALFMFFTKDIINRHFLLISAFMIVFFTRMVCYVKNLNLPVAGKELRINDLFFRKGVFSMINIFAEPVIKEKRKPNFGESVLAIALLIVLIGIGYIGFKWPVNPILVLASICVTFLAIRCGWTWMELQDAISKKFSTIISIILQNFIIGATIAVLISAGTIPYMIVMILKAINPSQLYLAAFISCSLFSVVTGTSWTTAGTIGLAMFGVAVGMDANVPMVVAAVVSGSIFGDKLSPLSETTNLAPLCAGTTVFSHIYSMLYTTIPTAIICAIFYYVAGMREVGVSTGLPETAVTLMNEIQSLYNLNVLLLIPFIIILGGAIFKKAAMPTLVFAAFAAVLISVFMQGVSSTNALNALLSGMKANYLGVEDTALLSSTTLSILQRGGANGMAGTNITVCCGYVYAAIVGAAGFIQTAMRPIINLCRGKSVKLIIATLFSDLLIICCAGSSYPAHIIVSEIYRKEYLDQGFDPKVLSRTLEDVGTMCTPLIPWCASGAYYIGLFGIPGYGAGGYLKYALNCWLNPLAAVVLAITGIGMFKMSEKKKEEEIMKYETELKQIGATVE